MLLLLIGCEMEILALSVLSIYTRTGIILKFSTTMKSIMLIKLTTAKQKMRGVLTFEQSTLPRISMG
ncbi:MAG TPA: hypothetical protein DDZ29_08410 [Alteromonas mediterranea]|nr:hypothetical protein [Alteromonas mediterranea]